MTFTLPQNVQEFFILLVPFLTLLLGIAYLIVPRRVLYMYGLEAKHTQPGSIGEGRSSFAGCLLAVSLGCLMLQEPIALQPGLNLLLAAGWTVAAFGRILQMLFDDGLRRKRIRVRFVLVAAMAYLVWQVTAVPHFDCNGSDLSQCLPKADAKELLLFTMAVIMLVFGLFALIFPGRVLSAFGLQPRVSTAFAKGEARGSLAGFHIAIGAIYLLMPQPIYLVALVMGAAWFFAGAGRLIAVLIDGNRTIINLGMMLFQIAIGSLSIALVLHLI